MQIVELISTLENEFLEGEIFKILKFETVFKKNSKSDESDRFLF